MSEHNPNDSMYITLLEDARNLENLAGMEKIMETKRVVEASEDIFGEETFDGVTINMERIAADLEIINLAGTAFNESLDALTATTGYSATEFGDSLFKYMETDEDDAFDWDSVNTDFFIEKIVLPVPHKLDINSAEKIDHDTSDYLSGRDVTFSDEILTASAKVFHRESNCDNDVTSEKDADSRNNNVPNEDFLAPPENRSGFLNSTSISSPPRTTQDTTMEVSTVKTHTILLSPKLCSDDDLSNYSTPSVSPTVSEDLTREDVTDENIILEFVNSDKYVTEYPFEERFGSMNDDIISNDLNKESLIVQEILKQVHLKPVDQVLDIIKKEYENRGAIPFYELVCDPQSFEMTVDNILHVSSLLSNRFIAMLAYDNDQLVIQPIPADERHSPQYALYEGYESVFSLDKKTWKRIIKVFKIEYAIIHIPDRD